MQTKTYFMADTEPAALEKVVGTPISWAAGKDPTKKVRNACGRHVLILCQAVFVAWAC